jgi:hypothetical protein
MSTKKSSTSNPKQKKTEVITFSDGDVRAVVYYGRAQDIGMPYVCYKVERIVGTNGSPSSFFFACHNDAKLRVSEQAADFCNKHQHDPDGAFAAAKKLRSSHNDGPSMAQAKQNAA